MAILITLLRAYAIWLYALFGIIALFALRSALKARAEIRQSIFSLEKEVARGRAYRSLFAIIAMVALSGLVFAGTHYIEPDALSTPIGPSPTATRLLRSTPTPSEDEQTPTPMATATRVRPPTRQPIPTAIPETPTATAAPVAYCPNAGVRVTSPYENAQLSGTVQVRGTAQIDNFWYYKIEIGIGSSPSDWSVIGDLHYEPVAGGVLASFNAAGFPAGQYSLRLVVVDKTGNFPEPCAVHVTITG